MAKKKNVHFAQNLDKELMGLSALIMANPLCLMERVAHTLMDLCHQKKMKPQYNQKKKPPVM